VSRVPQLILFLHTLEELNVRIALTLYTPGRYSASWYDR